MIGKPDALFAPLRSERTKIPKRGPHGGRLLGAAGFAPNGALSLGWRIWPEFRVSGG
jgi:hypothetical protein